MRFTDPLIREPEHQSHVIVKLKGDITFPATFFANNSYYGFYSFTTGHMYRIADPQDIYSKVAVKKIENVIGWAPWPESVRKQKKNRR